MSVPVDLDKLAGTLTEFGSGYLITVGEDFRAHIIAVEPVLTEGVLDTAPRAGRVHPHRRRPGRTRRRSRADASSARRAAP
jgi:hypothetical protein